MTTHSLLTTRIPAWALLTGGLGKAKI